jgi:peroxiredoxin
MPVLLVSAVVITVCLALRLKQVQDTLPVAPFRTSERAPTLRLQPVRGSTEVLTFDRGALPVLLYWFSPHCSWCEVNFANFQELAAQSVGRYKFVPISTASLTDLHAYVSSKGIQYPVYNISTGAASDYRLQGTPDTLLLSPRGVMIRHWPGAYMPSRLTEIESVLAINLPGFARTVTATK